MAKSKPHNWRKFNDWRFQLNESTFDDVDHYEAEIFDAIIAFRNVLHKSEWAKNKKINALIKQFLKLEEKLSNEVGNL